MSVNGSNPLSLPQPQQNVGFVAGAVASEPPPALIGSSAASAAAAAGNVVASLPQMDPAALSAIYASAYSSRQPNDSRNFCFQLPPDTELSVDHNPKTRQTFVQAHLPLHAAKFYSPASYNYPTAPPHYATAALPTAPGSGGSVLPAYYYGMTAAGMGQPPAATTAAPPPPRAPRRSNAIPIVDPTTKEVVNRQHLEGSRLTAAAGNQPAAGSDAADGMADGPTTDDTADPVIEKPKDDKEIAEVQHRFQDAVISKVMGQDTPQLPPQPPVSATPAAEAHKVWRISSQPKNDQSTGPTANSTEDVISLQNAVRERLAQAVIAKSVSPVDGAAPEILVDAPPIGEKIGSSLTEDENKSPSPSYESRETVDGLPNGAPSPAAIETSEEMERRLEEEYGQLDDQLTDVSTLIYGSKFLHLMRNVVKLKHIACPKTDAELRTIGIDRAGMLATTNSTKRYDAASGKSTFLPPFMHAVNNQSRVNRPNNYGGRHSDNKLRPKKPISGRTSMDRGLMRAPPPPPESQLGRRAVNAWRPPTRDRNTGGDINVVEAKYEKLRKEFRGLLNKITPSTYEALAAEFVGKRCYEDQRYMQTVIDLIFEKAVEEPHFCALYSDLCKRQVDAEYQASSAAASAGSGSGTEPRAFYRSIINKCQGTFLASTTSDETISRLEEELKAEDLELSRRDEIKEEIDRIKAKEKRRLNGIIRFIAELYRHNLLINPIINWCAVELVKRYDKTGDDVYIEYAVGMIDKVGKSYEKRKQRPDSSSRDQEPIDRVFTHLTAIKAKLSNRVRFMIMDLEDLRRNGWEPRHGNTGPKTIEEVHNEVANEQLINQQEREAYEKKTREPGGGGGGGRKGAGNKSYMGRGSTDSRAGGGNSGASAAGGSTEKRSQAALNAIQTGSSFSSLRKDTDLKKVEDQQRLSSSRVGGFKWGRSSVGGGVGEPPLARNSTPPSVIAPTAPSD